MEKPYVIDASTFPPEKANDFGDFRFTLPPTVASGITLSNDDRTAEWTEPSKAAWIPIATRTKLHSGRWFLEFNIESMRNRQIGVGFLLDWNVGPDWGFFGYLGASETAWAYDPSTGDIVSNTESIQSGLPIFDGDTGVVGIELTLPKDTIGDFTFIVNGVRTPTQPLPNSGAVAIPAVCLLSQGQKVTIQKLMLLDQGHVV